jgi:hypothetical protein
VARGPLVQRRTEGDHDVRLAEQPLRERSREAAGDAEVVGIAGEQAVGHGARGQQRARALAQRAQRRTGAGQHGAAPGDDRGLPCSRQQVGERGHRRRRGPRRGEGAAVVGRRGHAVGQLGGLHVEREHEDDGAALDPRAAHRAGDVGHRAGRPVHALGRRPDGLHEADLVDAEVRAHRRAGHVGRQHEQRRAALRRLGQARHRVGQTRPLVDAARREAPAHAAVAVGHADRARLVAGGEAARAGIAQGVGDGEVAAAHEPEDGFHPHPRQRAADRLSDEHGAGGWRGTSRRRCNQI